jgi:ABC-type nitrate/sulfonate/bicarbonate transport system substrate-binding protein
MAAEEPGTSLTPLGKILSILLILGLIGAGVYIVMQKSKPPQPATGGGPEPVQARPAVEAPDTKGITTVTEYKYVPAEKLPPVSGVADYKNWDEQNKVLRFSYNVWAGWLPLFAANKGAKPSADSVFAKKYGFKVELVKIDDPVAAREAFVTGQVHTLWGTVDMMVLFAPELLRDPRTSPRIVQQIDWSSGGDGIVVRNKIRTVADLKGKSIALAMNSPSQYFLTSLLLSAGLKPADVQQKFTGDAFQAAAAFTADSKIDGCVSWAPDIYNIADRIGGTRLLATTKDANKLIADVYAIRADFVRDHPDVVKGLVAGTFEGMDLLRDHPEDACKAMADAFGMKPDEVMGMRNDAHLTNYPENVQFFLNSSNPTNFERTWKNASYVYQKLGTLGGEAVEFDKVMDFSFVKADEMAKQFAQQKDESVATFTPSSYKKVQAEAPILTQTIRINFYPNSANPFEPARDEFSNPIPGKLYDPNVSATLERVAQLAGQFARCVILVEGHTDSSMKGKVPVAAVKDLSLARAEAVKQALIQKFKFDPNKFIVEGKGWDQPFDPADATNQALNRRTEISVYPPEEK